MGSLHNNHKLEGIITKRDIKNMETPSDTVENFMTKRENMVV